MELFANFQIIIPSSITGNAEASSTLGKVHIPESIVGVLEELDLFILTSPTAFDAKDRVDDIVDKILELLINKHDHHRFKNNIPETLDTLAELATGMRRFPNARIYIYDVDPRRE